MFSFSFNAFLSLKLIVELSLSPSIPLALNLVRMIVTSFIPSAASCTQRDCLGWPELMIMNKSEQWQITTRYIFTSHFKCVKVVECKCYLLSFCVFHWLRNYNNYNYNIIITNESGLSAKVLGLNGRLLMSHIVLVCLVFFFFSLLLQFTTV